MGDLLRGPPLNTVSIEFPEEGHPPPLGSLTLLETPDFFASMIKALDLHPWASFRPVDSGDLRRKRDLSPPRGTKETFLKMVHSGSTGTQSPFLLNMSPKV